MSSRNGTLESLLEPLMDRLYYTALDMTGNHADAQDVTQEAMLKAMRGYRTFIAGSDFKAWMFRILTNTMIDHYRKRRRGMLLLEDEAKAPENTAAPLPESVETEQVEAALRELDPEQRLAVILVDLHDFKIKEAAEMMGCPMGTVGSRLSRGRVELRRRLVR